ncbi:NAD(P)/FAD-dependent oxidoreductase [Pseudoduganella sp. SL102]|uniref:NAD(P)/FAD-dependent oxidoreductase n=1 Tax=Pseudoduganella sp. SL102 TaxID=2995154 RepID=UPI00248C0DAF|nr:NAD(P)/FAD-dependent oxidoreductase [Pseudoduganella sp. SL102]WBS02088.1 NAD(P)/FAD-dependent oxidoreductase [Pseudoduganella sp. SL102]
MQDTSGRGASRRQVLAMLGKTLGGAAMYHGMASLGFAQPSTFSGPLRLDGAPKGSHVLVLGAGMAGLSAAYELRNAGYQVTVLEYNGRAGGRSWSIRGGDRYTELGGAEQVCHFAKGEYVNPGPWRIPYHHHAMLDYARRLNVPLEPFIQVNYNAYLHSTAAFGGQPQRYRTVQADYHGHVAELLAKAANAGRLDGDITAEEKDKLLESLASFGGLNKDKLYAKGFPSSDRRGFDVAPGGGLMPRAQYSAPGDRATLIHSGLWEHLAVAHQYEFQSSIFQPKHGMDQIALALYRQVRQHVQFHAKVTKIDQDARGVTVTVEDARHPGQGIRQVKGDWCVCTIPLSILSQVDVTAGPDLLAAIGAVPYAAAFKAGLQFRRRFWEQDEGIYGGISYTDQPIGRICYPPSNFQARGPAVLLGAYMFGPNAFEFSAMDTEERLREVVRQGGQIHAQYEKEFDNGITVGWHRVPWINGCLAMWTEQARAQHYDKLCAIDNRLVLAGEHASFIGGWQEGAVLSAHDAITRLHAKARATTGKAA